MSGVMGKTKPKGTKFGPHTDDAKRVRQAFAEDARHPGRRETVTAEQLRHWAETGEWPGSSE